MRRKIIPLLASFFMLLTAFPAVSAQDASSADKLRVMPLGDSITDGFSTVGAYRVRLCSLLEQNGFSSAVDFVGPNWGGNCYDPQHAGYSGYAIDDIPNQRTGLYSFIDWLMESYPADVVMLQIGTNDILSHHALDSAGDRLEKLVDKILAKLLPDGMLFLATIPEMDASNTLYISPDIFTVEYMDACVSDYNSQIRAIVAKKQADGARIRLADINGVLSKNDLYDGVHPTEGGYNLMGDYWYGLLMEYMAGGTPGVPIIPGDADGDGVVNAVDKALSKRQLLDGIYAEGSWEYRAADYLGDGIVDAKDLSSLSMSILNRD